MKIPDGVAEIGRNGFEFSAWFKRELKKVIKEVLDEYFEDIK